jgi:hypothetical protein
MFLLPLSVRLRKKVSSNKNTLRKGRIFYGFALKLFFGKKSLEKETSMEQKTGACPDFLF